MTRDEQLRKEAAEAVSEHKNTVVSDPYRLHYHMMPPVGLLNDPNGFIQWKGTYHLFYQWMPFKTGHGAKFWGHYSSTDLVHWKEEEIALAPSEWFEKNGCYSGSAIEHKERIYAFYTGNVKDEEGNRESYQCLAVSDDGLTFEKKGPVIEVPKGYTAHFRDPKVWEQGDRYYMVVGAQTEDLKGAVALFSSDNLTEWTHEGILAGGDKGRIKDFGYMFECPDLFSLDEQDVLIFSPQGLEAEGMKYQNVYQAGYVIGKFDPETFSFDHGEFEELDRGFDFYAPQTTVDAKGRRILFAWMSVPDQDEQAHPTVDYKWLHIMTLPRELTIVDHKVIQKPARELEELREGSGVIHQAQLNGETIFLPEINGKTIELMLEEIVIEKGWFEINIHGAARLVYSSEQQLVTLERKSYVDGTMERRQCQLNDLESLQVFVDISSIEVFINEGRETFSARFFPDPKNSEITFGSSHKCSFVAKKWDLKKVFS
ncbi:glycoside hydrolase family 32 protein [Thalassorhabdus alkalitolerans]|uniref:Sucrose-6-phosphate hydrolase n=1 Tax=Thalassorhabdus alkalitolerans TaxID=2282697 RepID=A0ABW0YMS2_9BACI